MKTVVFVDDERTILNSLKKIFIDNKTKYIFLSNGHEALEYLENHQVDLICIDVHMDEIDGVILLRMLQNKYKDTMRVAMIDFSNKRLIKQLIEENLVHHTIFKPWNEKEFVAEISKMLDTQETLYSKSLLAFIGKVEALPTLPKIYDDLSAQVRLHASIAEISKGIQNDISLTAFVLKVANSAYYGRRTGNVTQAIMKIGLSNLKDIVLSYSVFNFLGKDQRALEDVWTKAILSNKMVSVFYECCLKEEIPMSYGSVGLLHDIGQLFLLTYKEKYGINDEIEFPTHENLGGYLLNYWDLPLAYVEGAMFHHRPLDERIIHKKLIYSLYVVHYFIDCVEDEETLEKVYDILGLDSEMVKDCLNEHVEHGG